jgi:hypothetical protein
VTGRVRQRPPLETSTSETDFVSQPFLASLRHPWTLRRALTLWNTNDTKNPESNLGWRRVAPQRAGPSLDHPIECRGLTRFSSRFPMPPARRQ